MTEPDDEIPPERLRLGGDEFLRTLSRSALLDRPTSAARAHAFERVLGSLERPSRRPHAWSVALGAVLGAAASAVIIALTQQRPQEPALLAAPERDPRPQTPSAAAIPAVSAPSRPPPALPPCPKLSRAVGETPLLDDFEDRNARLFIAEERSGTWMVQGVPGTKLTPSPGEIAFPVPIRGGREGSNYGLHLTGPRMTRGNAGLSVNPAPGRCYDASAYAGVEFYARGTGRVSFGATVMDVMAKEWGGSCAANCYDAHRKPVDLTRDFALYRVRWEELEQTGYGAAVVFDPARILALDFGIDPADTPFDLWIDDVRFMPR